MTDPILHIFVGSGPATKGDVALCGYMKRDTRKYTKGETCPKCTAYQAHQPKSTIYLSKHEHVWLLVGAKLWPVGTWHPVYQCVRCEDIVCDLSTDAKTLETS